MCGRGISSPLELPTLQLHLGLVPHRLGRHRAAFFCLRIQHVETEEKRREGEERQLRSLHAVLCCTACACWIKACSVGSAILRSRVRTGDILPAGKVASPPCQDMGRSWL